MLKFKCLIVSVLVLISAHPCFADDITKLVGTWRVISFETEYQTTGERVPVLGQNPKGYVIYTSEGRVTSLITAQGLKAATTDKERADLWRSMVAYTGVYHVEGDKCIAKVDVSSMPTWVGTERVFFLHIDGDRLQATGPWGDAPLYPERGKMRVTVTSERVK